MQFAGTLTPPAFPREYPYASAGSPHPARACGAPPPPPPGGGVRAWRYQGSNRARGGAGGKSYLGWSWWETVSGLELVGNRIRGGAGGPPCPALLRDLPVHWTVGISPRGEGPTGRGNSFPLPCLSRSRHLAPCQPYPARPSAGRLPIRSLPAPSSLIQYSHRGYPYALCRQPPPRPRLRRSSPAPSRGQGPCVAISGEQPYPGWNRWAAVLSSSPGSPHVLDRGEYRHGGRRPAGR